MTHIPSWVHHAARSLTQASCIRSTGATDSDCKSASEDGRRSTTSDPGWTGFQARPMKAHVCPTAHPNFVQSDLPKFPPLRSEKFAWSGCINFNSCLPRRASSRRPTRPGCALRAAGSGRSVPVWCVRETGFTPCAARAACRPSRWPGRRPRSVRRSGTTTARCAAGRWSSCSPPTARRSGPRPAGSMSELRDAGCVIRDPGCGRQ